MIEGGAVADDIEYAHAQQFRWSSTGQELTIYYTPYHWLQVMPNGREIVVRNGQNGRTLFRLAMSEAPDKR